MKKILRIDDIGASSKEFEIYAEPWLSIGRYSIPVPFSNFLWFKYIRPFKKWGPYQEMSGNLWKKVLDILVKTKTKMTVAVTACWVERNGSLTEFPRKFPVQAAILKDGVKNGILEIANHGLTHCVEKNKLFLPQPFCGNRRYHREFWDWVPLETQEAHLKRSQEILQDFFGTDIVTFVPPGNVFQNATLSIAKEFGIRFVSCNTKSAIIDGMVILGNQETLAFHDKELVENGESWLADSINAHPACEFIFVRDAAKQLLDTYRQSPETKQCLKN